MATTHTERSIAVPLACVYQVVVDIEAYPEFVPSCTDSKIISKQIIGESEYVDAELAIHLGPLHKTFVTSNINTLNTSIEINLLSGSLRQLKGLWTFRALNEHNTLICCDIEYNMGNGMLNTIVKKALKGFINQLSQAFVDRALAQQLHPSGQIN